MARLVEFTEQMLAANWRLFCPVSWDDTTTTITDAAKAAAVRARRADAGIPQQVRHRGSGGWRWT